MTAQCQRYMPNDTDPIQRTAGLPRMLSAADPGALGKVIDATRLNEDSDKRVSQVTSSHPLLTPRMSDW